MLLGPQQIPMIQGADDWRNAAHSTGTSIMAAEFDGGVIIGADSRTTTGAYIANRVTDKLTKVTDHIYCCRLVQLIQALRYCCYI
ncbi:hypothetical protein JTB14_007751 [Gonioctena quinquepunctata]|nr:hypothetical protein JTB14_007751 [Gonioctena quinquepunctata]